LDKRLPSDRKYKSDTYIFPQDIAPTLLDMAGGDIALLLGDNAGANYGNAMWEYIERSVDPAKEGEQKQKVRKVSYSKHLFFDVQTNRTMKNIYTGDEPQNVPRLWEPIWPKEGDLLMYVHFRIEFWPLSILTLLICSTGIQTTKALSLAGQMAYLPTAATWTSIMISRNLIRCPRTAMPCCKKGKTYIRLKAAALLIRMENSQIQYVSSLVVSMMGRLPNKCHFGLTWALPAPSPTRKVSHWMTFQ